MLITTKIDINTKIIDKMHNKLIYIQYNLQNITCNYPIIELDR